MKPTLKTAYGLNSVFGQPCSSQLKKRRFHLVIPRSPSLESMSC
jgi:hypothetical protein